MPPHLKAGISEQDIIFPGPEDLNGVVQHENGDLFYDNDGDSDPFDNPLDCNDTQYPNDLRACEPYIDSLYYFHGRGYEVSSLGTNVGIGSPMPNVWYNRNPDVEEFISPPLEVLTA